MAPLIVGDGAAHVTKVSGLDTMDFQSKRGMSVAPHTRTNSIPCGFGASGSAPGCSQVSDVSAPRVLAQRPRLPVGW